MRLSAYVLSILLCLPLWAGGASEPLGPLKDAVKKLRTAPRVKVDFKKEKTNEALGFGSKTSGVLRLSKGRLRMDVEKPEEATVVFDGKTLWHAQKVIGFEGESWQVLKVSGQNLKKVQSPLAVFLGEDNIWQKIHIDTEKSKGRLFVLKPQKPKEFSGVTEMRVTLNASGEILRFSYLDDIENDVVFEFGKFDLSAKTKSSLFKFKVPKGAEVKTL